MKIEPTQIQDVLLITPNIFRDERGYFFEGHRSKDLSDSGLSGTTFVQSNVSNSLPHVIRGIHFQSKDPQGKLMRCLRGSAYVVAVDLREGSGSFAKWVARNLEEGTGQALWIPAGFGAGFMAGSQGALMHYECTSYYMEHYAQVLRWDDPLVSIGWPLRKNPTDNPVAPIISNQDRMGKSLSDIELPKLNGEPISYDEARKVAGRAQ